MQELYDPWQLALPKSHLPEISSWYETMTEQGGIPCADGLARLLTWGPASSLPHRGLQLQSLNEQLDFAVTPSSEGYLGE